jgi:hypothetical protein
VLLLAVLAAHVAREHLPGVGGHHAAAVALQQGHAALLLEQADGAAHGRRVHVEHVGGAAHRAAVQHLHEVAHAARVELVVHGRVSWGLRRGLCHSRGECCIQCIEYPDLRSLMQ